MTTQEAAKTRAQVLSEAAAAVEADAATRAALDTIRARYDDILIILSPPRCASTALARAFWNQASTRAYLHEPFDVCYHRGASALEALATFDKPLEIRADGRNLVVKEMTFQVRDHLPVLLALTTKPVIFLLRDPRLSIRSRMRKRAQGGQPKVFPEVESGWGDLADQLAWCDARSIPYTVVDMTTLRNAPDAVLPRLCERIDLAFSPNMLSWEPCKDLAVGQLGAEQSHWYERVLESTGIQPATSVAPEIETFPEAMQEHARTCVALYDRLRNSEAMVTAT